MCFSIGSVLVQALSCVAEVALRLSLGVVETVVDVLVEASVGVSDVVGVEDFEA